MREQLTAFKKILDKTFFFALAGYFLFSFIFAFLAKLFADFKFFIAIDEAVFQFIVSLRIDFLIKFLEFFTNLGDTEIMVLWTLIVAGVLFFKKHYIYSCGIILSIGIAELMSFILKNAIGRARPPSDLALIMADSASFPSGHTIAAIAFFGFLAYFFYKNTARKFLRITLIFICIVIIFLAGFARIYLGVHWPSDVLAGYMLGGVWLLIIIKLIEKNKAILEN